MSRKIRTIQDVVDWNLCVGCGACVAVCRDEHGAILQDVGSVGIRPHFNGDYCKDCKDCLQVCPGHAIDASEVRDVELESAIENLLIGTHHALYEGHAADPYIRFAGSSSGMITALAAYCLEQEDMDFVLHTGMNPEEPWKNTSVISRSRDELIARAGSRYCTSSPCEWLDRIEKNDKPCVFIGKPCDVAALTKARRIRPALDRNVGLALSFFCAGTPCSDAVVELVNTLGADSKEISSVRFRGQGWPGEFRVEVDSDNEPITNAYIDTWKKLSKRRPFRCHICPDGMGQLSDIVSGDAWNRYTGAGENPGLSHVIVRTAHGREILKRAEDAGYLNLHPIGGEEIIEAQGLVLRRTVAFGRIAGMKLTGVPTTEFKNFHLFQAWLKNNPFTMVKSILGTLTRMVVRGLYKKGASYYQ